MFRIPGNVRHQVIGPGFGWMGGVVVPIINSDRFTLILQQKSLREFYCPQKPSMYHLHANFSRIFLIILSESSFKVMKKNTVPQIYVLPKTGPKMPTFCHVRWFDFLIFLRKSSGPANKIHGRHTFFPFLFSTSKNSVKI